MKEIDPSCWRRSVNNPGDFQETVNMGEYLLTSYWGRTVLDCGKKQTGHNFKFFDSIRFKNNDTYVECIKGALKRGIEEEEKQNQLKQIHEIRDQLKGKTKQEGNSI